jgi:DNA-binding transcriptional MerR regulator
MKMGEFCRQFVISEHTVRFYIKKGLLVPDLHKKEYRFNDASIADIGMILQLKSDGFTLDEIHKVISLFRLTGFATSDDVMQLQKIYIDKHDFLIGQLKQTKLSVDTLEQLIDELESEEDHAN